VTVWDITLPDMRAIPTWFEVDYNYLEKYHAGVHDCYYASCARSSAAYQVIKRHQEMLHQHRIDPRQTLVSAPNGCPPPINGSWYWKTDYDLMSTARRNIVNALLAGH
jgi:hypothetical protein